MTRVKTTLKSSLILGLLWAGAASLLACGTWLPTCGAWAQTAEEAYLVQRDAAIAKVKKREASGAQSTDAQMQQDTRVLEGLEGALRKIVGPVRVAGFPGSGKGNLTTLSNGDIGFGALDALTFAGQDGKSNLYVTTDALLTAWLKAHRKWWEDQAPMPSLPEEAARREAFYTQAISSDAAVILYTQLPIAKPTNVSLAMAQLEATTQDQTPPLPDMLLVTVMSAGKLLIVETPLKTPFKTISPCEAMRVDYEKRIAKLSEAQSRKPDEAAADESTKLTNAASADALRCFKDHAATEPAFAAARKQAQALIDQLAKP